MRNTLHSSSCGGGGLVHISICQLCAWHYNASQLICLSQKKNWDLFLRQHSINKDLYPPFLLSPKTKCASNLGCSAVPVAAFLEIQRGKIQNRDISSIVWHVPDKLIPEDV